MYDWKFRNSFTRMMDDHIRESDKIEDFFVYIYSNDGIYPLEVRDNKEDEYLWLARYPGYTCANIFFDQKKNTIKRVCLTRRGGGFKNAGQETIFKDPDALEELLNKEFVGKTLDFDA